MFYDKENKGLHQNKYASETIIIKLAATAGSKNMLIFKTENRLETHDFSSPI